MNFGDFEALSQFRTQDVQQDKDTTTQLQFDKVTSSLYRSLPLASLLQFLLQVNDPCPGFEKFIARIFSQSLLDSGSI